ncbi:rhamnolipids biosynthesis 3-oxoacyl-reductase [Peniophora sp. CONT]|nr:rhamnolipids biosynthesis 3-oxoacyl-reductase [Peniophora sp. CONT]
MSGYPDLSSSSLFGGFKGKVAVVTGGGSGIGTMIATAYVQNGAKVYISSRKEKQLKETADSLNKLGPGSCYYVVADLSNKAGCDKLVDEIKAKESKIHILVNNSGMSWGAPIDSFPEKEGWDRLFALNVKSIFYMTVGLADLLAKDATSHSPGSVINMSSVAGLNPIADAGRLSAGNTGVYSYNASKAAVNHLTSSLAVTYAKRFITVNAICPGVFPSKMTAFGVKKAGGIEAMGSDNPFKRIGEPQDMAGLALFLSSPAGAYVTGVHIALDGGANLSRGADMLGGSQPKL